MSADPAARRVDAHTGLAGRPVLVMGLGSFGGGVGAARYLASLGARVVATDLRGADELSQSLAELDGLGVRLALGGHDPADFERAELVVANPAVRADHPLLEGARRAGARVTTEIELALEALPGRLVAVTGTHGKSSTCRMLTDLLNAAGVRAHLSGNFGGSLLEARASVAAGDVVVLEVSSYQLEGLGPFPVRPGADPRRRVEAAAIANVLADHLERHGTVERYRAAKLRILDLVADGGTAVVPPDLVERVPRELRAVALEPERERGSGLWLDTDGFRSGDLLLAPSSAFPHPAAFQRPNALLALGLARSLGLAPERLAGALPSAGVPAHRLEDLGARGGRRVWDNAVSTTPESTVSALESLGRVDVLIAGGRAKRGLGYAELARAAAERVERAVLFGEAAPELAELFRAAGVETEVAATVEDALSRARALSRAGGALLFSPACSSFDAYLNWTARAGALRAALHALDARAVLDAPESGAPPSQDRARGAEAASAP